MTYYHKIKQNASDKKLNKKSTPKSANEFSLILKANQWKHSISPKV